jgi:glycogen(starch) synthase
MNEMKVLLLGWEFLPDVLEKNGKNTACYTLAKALGDQVDLSWILPVADPDFILQNVHLSGLNNIDLPALEPTAPKKGIQPFAQGEHIRSEIPLYGAPIQPASQDPSRAEQPGQAASAGILQRKQDTSNLKGAVENPNFFSQKGLDQVSLDAQIIQYARWATRLAAHRQFDVIYAYDWQTYLAGSELKLVSQKPLVLQVHSLSQDRKGPNSQGWMYQMEMQALQKADCIITASDRLADLIKEKYHISPDVIYSLAGKKPGPVSEKSNSSGDSFAAVSINALETNNKAGLEGKSSLKEEPKENGTKTADKIRDILQKVAA